MPNQEQFNPYNKKYEKTKDLPENQQQNFVDIKGGKGFIKKEVMAYEKELEDERNDSIMSRIFGNKASFINLEHEKAIGMDEYETKLSVMAKEITEKEKEMDKLRREKEEIEMELKKLQVNSESFKKEEITEKSGDNAEIKTEKDEIIEESIDQAKIDKVKQIVGDIKMLNIDRFIDKRGIDNEGGISGKMNEYYESLDLLNKREQGEVFNYICGIIYKQLAGRGFDMAHLNGDSNQFIASYALGGAPKCGDCNDVEAVINRNGILLGPITAELSSIGIKTSPFNKLNLKQNIFIDPPSYSDMERSKLWCEKKAEIAKIFTIEDLGADYRVVSIKFVTNKNEKEIPEKDRELAKKEYGNIFTNMKNEFGIKNALYIYEKTGVKPDPDKLATLLANSPKAYDFAKDLQRRMMDLKNMGIEFNHSIFDDEIKNYFDKLTKELNRGSERVSDLVEKPRIEKNKWTGADENPLGYVLAEIRNYHKYLKEFKEIVEASNVIPKEETLKKILSSYFNFVKKCSSIEKNRQNSDEYAGWIKSIGDKLDELKLLKNYFESILENIYSMRE